MEVAVIHGRFRITIKTVTVKLTNVRIARQCRDLVRECDEFVEYKAKITSKVTGVKRRVMYFSKLLLGVRREEIQSWRS